MLQAVRLVRREGDSRPSDYVRWHPLLDSPPPSLESAARVPFPFLGWDLLLPVSEPPTYATPVSATLPLQVTLTHADLSSTSLQENLP